MSKTMMTSLSSPDNACKLAQITLQIPPRRICFLKFILEGYDGLATLSTVDAGTGLVTVYYDDNRHEELRSLLASLPLSAEDIR